MYLHIFAKSTNTFVVIVPSPSTSNMANAFFILPMYSAFCLVSTILVVLIGFKLLAHRYYLVTPWWLCNGKGQNLLDILQFFEVLIYTVSKFFFVFITCYCQRKVQIDSVNNAFLLLSAILITYNWLRSLHYDEDLIANK